MNKQQEKKFDNDMMILTTTREIEYKKEDMKETTKKLLKQQIEFDNLDEKLKELFKERKKLRSN